VRSSTQNGDQAPAALDPHFLALDPYFLVLDPTFWRSSAIVHWKTLKSAELIWKDGNPTPTRF
jgi:hypothetical protein